MGKVGPACGRVRTNETKGNKMIESKQYDKRKVVIQENRNGLRIECDASEIHPMDPGQGTPLLVCLGGRTASLDCAAGEGEIDGEPLNYLQMHFLHKWQDWCEAWLDHHYKLHPRYEEWKAANL
jgi:hypothetical protein